MRWLQLSIQAPPEYVEPLTYLFNTHGDSSASVEVAGGYNPDEGEKPDPTAWVVIRGWLPLDSTTQSRKTAIDVGVRLIKHLVDLPELEEKVISDEEWSNQKFRPIKVGKNLVILPRSAEYKPNVNDVLVELDPGLAFGTGHHPTTLMCLEEIEKVIRSGDNFLDLGCGSGVLSIAALALGAKHAIGLDVEQQAVTSSLNNISEAGFENQATILWGSIPHPQLNQKKFEVIGANISANVLIELAGPLLSCLQDDGVIVSSGVLETRLCDVTEAFRAVGGEVQSTRQIEDWTASTIIRVNGLV